MKNSHQYKCGGDTCDTDQKGIKGNDSRGKKREFEILVKKNMKRAYFSALGILGSHDAAMDLSQEAFIRAYKHFNRFDTNKNFFTWFYKILRNLCLNFIRDNKNRKEDVIFENITNPVSTSLQQATEEKELIELLHNAINTLSPDDREVIILKEFEGYSYNEISEMLNLPAGTVMSRLYYARKKLAKKMKMVTE